MAPTGVIPGWGLFYSNYYSNPTQNCTSLTLAHRQPSVAAVYAASMGDTMLSCELCEPGRRVFVPKLYAHAMVFHALIHHGVTLSELETAVRYTSPHGEVVPFV